MKGLLKKILIGAVCVFAVVGLSGCGTEGLSEEQINTLFTTLEKTQTFMSDVNDALDERIEQDKKELDELKLQNDLKEVELEKLEQEYELKTKELEEVTRQNNLKEEELKLLETPTKEDAIIRFKRALLNWQLREVEPRLIYTIKEANYTETRDILIHKYYAKDHTLTYYFAGTNNYRYGNLEDADIQYFAGYAPESVANNSKIGCMVTFDTAERKPYESIIDDSIILEFGDYAYYAISQLHVKFDENIDSVKLLDNGDLEIGIVWTTTDEENDYLYGGRAILDQNDIIKEVTTVTYQNGILQQEHSIAFDYNTDNSYIEFMSLYNEVLDGYEYQLPKLYNAINEFKQANNLTIYFEGEEENTWSTFAEFEDNNPGSEAVTTTNNLGHNYKMIDVIDDNTTTFTYSRSGVNNNSETVNFDVIYTVTDNKLVSITVVYDAENTSKLIITYPEVSD